MCFSLCSGLFELSEGRDRLIFAAISSSSSSDLFFSKSRRCAFATGFLCVLGQWSSRPPLSLPVIPYSSLSLYSVHTFLPSFLSLLTFSFLQLSFSHVWKDESASAPSKVKTMSFRETWGNCSQGMNFFLPIKALLIFSQLHFECTT